MTTRLRPLLSAHAVLLLATGALVALTSGATVVLTGTAAVVSPPRALVPLPAAPRSLPPDHSVVMLPPAVRPPTPVSTRVGVPAASSPGRPVRPVRIAVPPLRPDTAPVRVPVGGGRLGPDLPGVVGVVLTGSAQVVFGPSSGGPRPLAPSPPATSRPGGERVVLAGPLAGPLTGTLAGPVAGPGLGAPVGTESVVTGPVGTEPITTAPAAPVAPAPLAGARVETSFGIASVEPAVMASPTDPADDRKVSAKAPPAAERPAARPTKVVQSAKRKPAASKPATSKPAGRTVSKKAAPQSRGKAVKR